MMESINNKRFSGKLNKYFRKNIKLSFVSEENVIIITNDDKCYVFRKEDYKTINKNLMIFLSDNKSIIEPLIKESFVEEMSHKQIVDFKNGGDHVIARTLDGKVHYLKYDFNEQKVIYKPEVNQFLIEENVIDMCCGHNHTLFLTNNGRVFAWGQWTRQWNINGPIEREVDKENLRQSKIYELKAFNDERVIAISCGSYHSMVLTERGRVYSWGYNDWGQLGIGIKIDFSYSPKMVELSEHVIIKKINCGSNHSLLLSRDGDIYVCGQNRIGKFGKIFTPMKLSHSEKFIDIASHSDHSFSAAISQNSTFYIWGKCGGEVITEPKETEFKSLNDIFEHYFRITYETIKGKVIQLNNDSIENGKYENLLIEKSFMGRGSYGEVFEVCLDSNETMKFAIKKIRFEAMDEEDFMNELKTSPLILQLNHVNIVRYIDLWLENDFTSKNVSKLYAENFILCILMEFCDKSLNDIIDELKNDTNFYSNEELTSLGYYIASEIFIEILEGVNYLHEQCPQIIHRDLNPSNIMLRIEEPIDSVVKIIDFGLVTIHKHPNQSHTQDKGHNEFLAPEVRDSEEYDIRADIYSLGILLQKLFFIDVNRDYNEKEPESLLINKYKEIINLCDRMTQRSIQQRPDNIKKILEQIHLWALDRAEFNLKHEIIEYTKKDKSKESLIKITEAFWKKELSNEKKIRFLSMGTEEKRKHYKCGNYFKTLSDIKTWNEYSKLDKIQNKLSITDYRFNNEVNKKVSIYFGDITTLETDVIVNAANKWLVNNLGVGEGVNGVIHSAADRQLLQIECQSLNGCKTGDCRITGGYKLPAKYVIHAVGPDEEEAELLQSCYKNSLDLMSEKRLKSIAFPCISTGIKGYPNEAAAHVALRAVRNWFDRSLYSKEVDRVIFCLFLQTDTNIYNNLMYTYFPLQ